MSLALSSSISPIVGAPPSSAEHGAGTYALDPAWRVLLADLGVEPADLLRRAQLPEDLLSRVGSRVGASVYFRIWTALEAIVGPPLPLRIAQALRPEAFSPPLFAALCSPNLAVALRRIAEFKSLVAPIRARVEENDQELSFVISWLAPTPPPPATLVAVELVFVVLVARFGTRLSLCPKRVTSNVGLAPEQAYADLFGVPPERGTRHAVTWRREDAYKPFLTAHDGMWSGFEPALRRRLADIDAQAGAAERTRATLLECLPSGQATLGIVAKRLGTTERTLQRRLQAERTSFQQVLQETRAALARHYLQNTRLPTAEISFLLGFAEPNSFYRAFHDWTGLTPDTVRRAAGQRAMLGLGTTGALDMSAQGATS